jgi:hypothetical protein
MNQVKAVPACLAVILTGVAYLDANKYMIIQSLRSIIFWDTYLYEFPTGSGNKMNLNKLQMN